MLRFPSEFEINSLLPTNSLGGRGGYGSQATSRINSRISRDVKHAFVNMQSKSVKQMWLAKIFMFDVTTQYLMIGFNMFTS